jgi:putative transposase
VRIGSIGSISAAEDGNATELEDDPDYGLKKNEILRATELAEKVQEYKDGNIPRPKEVPARTWRSMCHKAEMGVRNLGSAVLGLVRKKPSGNPRPNGSLDEESRTVLEKHIEDHYERSNADGMLNCFFQYEAECKKENEKRARKKKKLLTIASYSTYRLAVINRRGEAQTRKRFGLRAANQKRHWIWYLVPHTPPHGDRPFQIAHIDSTLIDLQTLGRRRRKAGKRRNKRKRTPLRYRDAGRLWWTTMVDAYSRRILAQYITYDPPSYRSCMMVIRECVRRFGRLPQTLVVDNGREFKSCYFRFFAARFKIAIKYRPKGNPRYGSVQERPFGTANRQFFHKLLGNTKLTRQIRLVVKSHNPVTLAVWNLEALIPHLDKWSYVVYDTQSHSGIRTSPREAFLAGIAKHGEYPNSEIVYGPKFIYLTAPTTAKGTAKVIEQGPYVVINYIKYSSPLLNNPKVLGKQAEVRFDPYDIGHAWVFIGREFVECHSEFYAELRGKSEKLIRMVADRINAENKAHPLRRRTVNATTLAEFLRGIDDEEELLIQAQRDEEIREYRSRMSSPGVDKPAVMPKESATADHPKPSHVRKPVQSVPRVTESCVAI